MAACELVPHTRVRFGAPAGPANRLGEGECADSRVDDDGDGILHEMGIPPPVSSDPR